MEHMDLDRRRWLAGAGGLTLGAAMPAWSQGEDYPARPVTLVCAYPPGGSTDLTARTLAAEMARRLGRQVIVENIGGAGGTLGAQKVQQAAPDGYTLLLGANNEMAIAGLVNSSVRYDPVRQFTPIGRVASQPMVLVASPKTGIRDVAGFIELVSRNPGRFSYGSSGVGTALHLAGEMVKEAAGLFIVHIPYRGVAPLTTDLLGGQLEFGVFVLSSGLPHIRSGRVAAIGTTEGSRSAITPDIPALAEHPRLRNVDIGSWFGLWGPAGLPQPVVRRLQSVLADSLAAPEFLQKMRDAGATVSPPGAELRDFQVAEIAKYRRIVDYARIRE